MHWFPNTSVVMRESSNKVGKMRLLMRRSSHLLKIMCFTIAGDVADGMYFIEDGNVVVKMDQDGKEIEISRLGKGQYFGELALVTHRPRAASVYADGDVKVACKWVFHSQLTLTHLIIYFWKLCFISRFYVFIPHPF